MLTEAGNQAKFLKSVATEDQLPPDKGWEIAFIGRSNAGKSSALNAITGIKGLARASKTPGRTQMINLFTLGKNRRLVDLPGYGYAKVPITVKERWASMVDDYLENRRCLQGLVLVMDIRHTLKDIDRQIIAWTTSCGIETHILLTKADKLKPREARNVFKQVQEELADYGDVLTLQIFSSMEKTGLEEARRKLNEWFEKDRQDETE